MGRQREREWKERTGRGEINGGAGVMMEVKCVGSDGRGDEEWRERGDGSKMSSPR